MKKDKSLIITILILVVVVAITIITCSIIFKLKTNDKEDSNKTTEKIDLLNYKLTEENQTLNVDDHLTIKFIGNKVNDLYKYTLEMFLDNNKLNNNTFFEDQSKDIVYSYSYAYFKIENINNYYLIQYIKDGSQSNGRYVIILDNQGNLINSFENVYFKFDYNTYEYDIEKSENLEIIYCQKYILGDKSPIFNEVFKSLAEEKETFKVDDKLTLNFNGYKVEDMGGYTYNLDIIFNNKKLNNNTIFERNDKRFIWSSNFSAGVNVIILNNQYIIDSYIGEQVNGHYLVILDENGKLIKSFEDVDYEIIYDKMELHVRQCEVMKDCYEVEPEIFSFN